jgi:hypothetical protein
MLQQDKLVCLFPSSFVECLGEGLELTLKAWGSEMTPWHTLALLEIIRASWSNLQGLNTLAYFVVESVKKVCSIDTCFQSHTTDFVVCDA